MSSHQSAAVIEENHEDRQQSLAEAFAFFNETSQQLAQSYQLLEKRVQQLSAELDQAQADRDKEHKTKLKIASRMRALLDFLPGGVVVLDANGVVLECNPAAVDLLQCQLDGWLWRDAIKQCFAPKNDDGLEVSTHSGKRISIATSSLGNDGQIILLTDHTETRNLQQSLSRHERLSAMGKMVSALAHQIRTPLSAAILYAGHLCGDKLSEEKKQQFSQKVLGRLHHMEKQVRDMLLFVKNELPLNDTVSVGDLEQGLRDAAEAVIMNYDIRCTWRNTCPNLKIKCHREALISALMNLVNNGIQASENAGKLEISFSAARADRNAVEIKVRDFGNGMTQKEIARVQEMFVTTKAQGTGLGLSVVNSVIRAHGGQFLLQSQCGAGSNAIVQLSGLNVMELKNKESLV